MQEKQKITTYIHCTLGCTLVVCIIYVFGCGPKLSTTEQILEFKKAGPIRSPSDVNSPVGLKSHVGPYRVMSGDILEFMMPVILRVISADLPEWLRPAYGHKDVESYLVRVSRTGTITLPIVGEIEVIGKTLAEIETSVIDAYFPKYVVNRPMVVCEVKKYQSESERIFAVIGLVNKSGIFSYPADVQYNLMEALAFAGGLDMIADPRYLKIYRQDVKGKVVSSTFGINKGALDDAYSLTIKPGDLIYVDHTFRTRFNKFMSEVFFITVGVDSRYATR